MIFFIRVEQSRFFHRLLSRFIEFEPYRALVTSASQATPIYHRGEVHQAFRCKLLFYVTCPWLLFHASHQPSGHPSQQQVATSSVSPTAPTSDPKRPYGGLVPSQPKGTRAFQDAASYNQHLAQHQAFTAQAQAASQAANNVFRNPYITTQLSSQPSSSAYPASATDPGNAYSQPPQAQYAANTQSQVILCGDMFILAHMSSSQDRTMVEGCHSSLPTHPGVALGFQPT